VTHSIQVLSEPTLRSSQRTGIAERPATDTMLFDALQKSNLINDAPINEKHKKHISMKMKLSSRNVTLAAKPFKILTFFPALLLMLFLIVAAFSFGAVETVKLEDPKDWFADISISRAIYAFATFLVCVCLHEVGHAAACFRLTGITGVIRLSSFRGMPALIADVSSIHLTTPAGRAIIAISGVIFQCALATCLLLIPDQGVRLGATLSIMTALVAVFPMPKSDGYWFIRDLFQLRLKPSLKNGNTIIWSDIVYGYWLLGMTLWIFYILGRMGTEVIIKAWLIFGVDQVQAFFLIAFGIYTIMVMIIMVWKNIGLLKGGLHEESR
jgi:hypothetical protein